MSKKILFIIVEGISDQTALATIISKLITNNDVRVEFTSCDLTTEISSTSQNIKSKVGDFKILRKRLLFEAK